MKCADLQKLIPLYLERGLSEEEMRPLRAHVSSCPTCHREAWVYRELQQLLVGCLKEPRAPKDSNELFRRLEERIFGSST